jgi:hypothetical protein
MSISAGVSSESQFLRWLWKVTRIFSGLLVIAVFLYPLIEMKMIVPWRVSRRVNDGREIVKFIHAQDAALGHAPRDLWPTNYRKVKSAVWQYTPQEDHYFVLSSYVGTISRTSVMYRETLNPDLTGWFVDYDGESVPYGK